MGQSTDAILCYGFELEDADGCAPEFLRAPEDDEDGDDKDFDQFIFEHYAPELVDYNPDDYEKRRAVILSTGVRLIRHCSCGYPMYILAVAASHKEASRGEPVDLGQAIHGPIGEWRELLEGFCVKVGIPFKQPSWLLCSDWC